MKRGRRRARGGESGTLSTRVRRIWEVVTTTLALLTAIYLVLNTIEPTRMVLERHVLKLNVEALTAIVAIMLEVAIVAVYQLGRQVRAMRAELRPREATQIVDDVGGVVEAVKRLSRTGRRSERTLEVLGLTLNTTWPQLVPWMTGPDAPAHWRVTLYSLDPAFVEGTDELPGHWSGEAARTQERIRALAAEESEDLAQRRIELELRTYACVPVVHGFRLGNGDLFLAYLPWTKTGSVRPFEFYEHIPHHDTSPRANRYRDLFDSWLHRAAAKTTSPQTA